jgi:uncharacterized delta-60 repeat protein
MMRTLTVSACFALFALAARTSHATGALDPTFATVSVRPANVGQISVLQTLLRQPGGKIVAAGTFGTPYVSDAMLARVTSSGGLDPTFGSGGIADTHVSAYDEIAAIALGTNDAIVAAGGTGTSFSDLRAVVMRYDADGALDASFGIGGVLTTAIAGKATAVVVQPDDAVAIVAGTVIARFLADGTPDPGFGTAGIVDAGHALRALVRLPDGTLVAAGQAGNDVRLLRLLADGTPDASFGAGGSATIPFAGPVSVHAMLRQPDGRLVIGGEVGSPPATLLIRALDDGTLDPSFGAGGVQTPNGPGFIGALALQSDGKIIVGGGSGGTYPVARFERYSLAGAREAGFASGFDASSRAVAALLVEPDDRIVVTKLIFQYGVAGGMITLGAISNESNRYYGVGACGDGALDPGEDCEAPGDPCCALCRFTTASCASDDNACTTDRCASGTCTHTAVAGSPSCDDGNLCTTADRCVTGVCAGLPVVGPPCQRCIPETGAFVPGPRLGCKHTTQPGRSSLTIKDVANAGGDALTWKWTHGEATTLTELRDPVHARPEDGDALCVFDESGPEPALIAALFASVGDTSCRRPPCWKARGNRLTYKSVPANASGTTGLVLAAGAAGKSSMRVTGKGANLFAQNPIAPPLPGSPLPLPLRVQLGSSDGACWEATFSPTGLHKNAGGKLVATSD